MFSRTTTFLIGFVIFAACSNSQEKSGVLQRYREAYKWILSSSEAHKFMQEYDTSTGIMLSDSIAPLEIASFFDQLRVEPGVQRKVDFLDSLVSLDNASRGDTSSLPDLRGVAENSTGRFVLFFSRPRGGVILAELFYSPRGARSYEEVARLTSSLLFLLRFDLGDRITGVMTTKPQYE